jgi:hypothetical protein
MRAIYLGLPFLLGVEDTEGKLKTENVRKQGTEKNNFLRITKAKSTGGWRHS